MNWIYPEEGHEWEEGEEIVAEWWHLDAEVYVCRLLRHDGGWIARKPGWNMEFSDKQVTIRAYVPYVRPEPPEEPQDCPFCGAKMKVYENAYGDYIAICSKDECLFRTPSFKTQAEAIKALNSVRVESE